MSHFGEALSYIFLYQLWVFTNDKQLILEELKATSCEFIVSKHLEFSTAWTKQQEFTLKMTTSRLNPPSPTSNRSINDGC